MRGIIRQHQFQKVELVKFSKPEDSYNELEKLTRNAEDSFAKARPALSRHVVVHGRHGTIFGEDLRYGSLAAGAEMFREISSCSNFESYQARRANIRYRPEGKNKPEFVHTLNGSAFAVGRTWVAIIENYQQADGTVLIPEALRPYMGADTNNTEKAMSHELRANAGSFASARGPRRDPLAGANIAKRLEDSIDLQRAKIPTVAPSAPLPIESHLANDPQLYSVAARAGHSPLRHHGHADPDLCDVFTARDQLQ